MKLHRPMLGLAALACLAMPLAGCTTLGQIAAGYNAFKDATIPGNVAVAGAYAFDGTETAATDILVDCTPHNPPLSTQLPAALCSAQRGNIQTMIASIKAGRPIRDAIEPAPGQTAPVSSSAYSKLEAIVSTLTTAVTAFNAAKAGE